MATIVNLLVGGPTANYPADLTTIPGPWVGTDRGALRLVKRGIQPVMVVGDFDSIDAAELQTVKDALVGAIVVKPDQDHTDTQLAIKSIFEQLQPDAVHLYGATGGRLDHLLANMWLVLDPVFRQWAPQIKLIDKQNSVQFFLPGDYQITKEADKRYLAFVPLMPMHLTLPDEKYQLDAAYNAYPISWASNEFSGNTGHFSFDAGVLAVIQSRDDSMADA
ncbi:thiamine diphosphokinase [Lactiplantibacillus plantarum]|jgi:thiamine pyrophosphokinase|uniref:thiamine diphosphokinase n=1 Tax=Lactiplantibacillus plantarum TaxID=1590 RepID=UPI0006A5DFC7|nr:thiamine diphosphokinase [Lactiplantibacillus plantarum]ASD32596.1 thiamine pyrophosphokinase [Lactiplantibacillus plantarum]AXI12536.1 thiamine diphosphokinase [Lactiplantibacillus plantarum]KOE71794.1 thiamine pyrophosphokinase [Lactiplantibacillus plantarum]MBW4799504.1 thiamine diphosphokinase [Lactiplantibacillus plantarum]MBW4807495.1 thiamine diphosphokinase [Lactiplantibacillus plantarum]